RKRVENHHALCDFYPRPPRGGRLRVAASAAVSSNFYPRPPRGGRPGEGCLPLQRELISTHALREEGDHRACRTAGCRRPISTHALREEGDGRQVHRGPSDQNFYPRPPRGGRPPRCTGPMKRRLFLPTPSARRATANVP